MPEGGQISGKVTYQWYLRQGKKWEIQDKTWSILQQSQKLWTGAVPKTKGRRGFNKQWRGKRRKKISPYSGRPKSKILEQTLAFPNTHHPALPVGCDKTSFQKACPAHCLPATF